MKTKMKKYKTGGVIVGLNGSLNVQTIPGSKGVMPGLNGKVSAQTNPGGWAGGRGNSAPKTAEPSAKKGGSIKGMKNKSC